MRRIISILLLLLLLHLPRYSVGCSYFFTRFQLFFPLDALTDSSNHNIHQFHFRSTETFSIGKII